MRVRSSDPRLAFDGSTAVVVHDYEDRIVTRLYRSSYRLCKNEFGEYFLLSGNPVRSMHLNQQRAMNALRIEREAFAREFGSEEKGS